MKVQIILPLSIAVSLTSFAMMKTRVKDLAAEEKKVKFQDVKLRVTEEVLAEYVREKTNIEKGMEKEKAALEAIQKALAEMNNEALKTQLDECKGAVKKNTDEIGSLQGKVKTFQETSAKEKTAWEKEIATLNEKLNAPSPICNYLKAGTPSQGLCPEKKEEPKVEPPKPAEEKKEEIKPEAPKPDAPKADAPKPEAPKQEEAPKPEAPKQEAPQPEAPKQEAPKQEAPKQEAPKQEAPKQEAPKQEAPKQEAPKPEAPKPEAPKQEEAPKQDAPKQ